VFESFSKPNGREYTKTVAWLAIAIIFIPAIFVSIGTGFVSLAVAGIGSLICAAMAWLSWKQSPELPIAGKPIARTAAK